MPKPPAAFSPLTTTKSSFQRSTSPGRRWVTAVRPLRPTTSPMNSSRISRGPAKVNHLALGEHEIERSVPFGRRHGGDLLGGKRQADRHHRFLGAQPVDGEIIVAGAVADAVTASIEGGERHEQDI